MIEEDFENCMPGRLEPDSKYHSGDYNCHYCDNKECTYYYDFHEEESEE